MIKSLNSITEIDIKKIADSVIRARGKAYYKEGLVRSLETNGKKILAEVEGNSIYDVEISIEKGELECICSCPYDGEICKHVVAVLYQWINRNNEKNKTNLKIAKSPEYEKYLESLSKKELIFLLLELSKDFKEVKHNLSLRTAALSTEQNEETITTIISHFKRELASNNLDYYQLPYVIRSLERIKQSINNISPEVRQRLLEVFIEESVKAYEEGVDDSNGRLGDFISDCTEDLGKAIAEQNLPYENKKEIIKKYIKAIKDDEYGFEDNYWQLLLTIAQKPAEYNFLISEIKFLAEKTTDKYEKDNLKEFLIELYEKSGKGDEYLKEIENKLEWSGDYLRLAEYWKDKGNVHKAIEIAQQGIDKRKNSFGNEELFRFLEELYKQKGNEKELLATYISHFSEASSLPFYRKIKSLAKKYDRWEKHKHYLLKEAKPHVYIDILLDEGEEGMAIKEAISNDELPDKSKEKIAGFIKEKYPNESLQIYDLLVNKYISYGARGAYREAVQYLRNVKEIYLAILDDIIGWERYIEKIKKENYRKSALLSELRKINKNGKR